MTKPLAIIGALSLVAWTGLGLFAWSRVHDSVHVTVTDSSDPPTADAALLADRMGVLDADMDALVGSLGNNFQLVAAALESGGEATGSKLAQLEARLAALEAAVPSALEARETGAALTAALDRTERLAVRLESSVATGAMLASADAQEAERALNERLAQAEREQQARAAEMAARRAADAAAAEAPTGAAVAASAAPAPDADPARPKSFLAFDLPDRDFAFKGRRTYEVLGDLSRVGFDAKSTLHDFTGVTSKVTGSFTTDLAEADAGIEGLIEVDARSLDSGLAGRDEAMLEHLSADEYGTISFAPTGFERKSVDEAARTVAGRLTGDMTIRGVTRSISLDVKGSVDDARRLVVEGETPLDLTAFEVPVPNKLGMISMEKEVRMWLRLRLRAKAGRN